MTQPGQIIVLNGAPRSGKSSIAAAIQDSVDGTWMHLGVDTFSQYVTPPALRPGIGLRPGGERPDLERHLPTLFAALYDSVAAMSRLGLGVVVDVGHHDEHSRPLDLLAAMARRLAGLPVLLVGVRCPIEVIVARRAASAGDLYEVTTPDGVVPQPVRRWQEAVHRPGIYDLEVDTARHSPAAAAAVIREHLDTGAPQTAMQDLAAR